jgi:hypothetical protein
MKEKHDAKKKCLNKKQQRRIQRKKENSNKTLHKKEERNVE